MNWKLRLKNKTTLITLIAAAISLVYQVLSLFGVMPAVTQAEVMETVNLALTVLCVLGIVVDPTTEGIADSARAMGYDLPSAGEVDEE